jgi:hypothetical protein
MSEYKFKIPLSSDSWETHTDESLSVHINNEAHSLFKKTTVTIFLSKEDDEYISFDLSEISILVNFLYHNKDNDRNVELEINTEDDKWNKYKKDKLNFCIYSDIIEFEVSPKRYDDGDDDQEDYHSREIRLSSKEFHNVLSFIVL